MTAVISKITGSSRSWDEVKATISVGSGTRWHAASCVKESDAHVLEWLKKFQFETYYPQLRQARLIPLRRQSHKQRRAMFRPTEVVDVPLFPRYVFVRFDPRGHHGWHEQFETAGAAGILCHGDVPAPIADAVIAGLRGKEADGALAAKVSVRFVIELGARVLIGDGPFAGLSGVVAHGLDVPIGELDAHARIRVLASLFGRETPIELEVTQVQRI